jgi:hypothetical protein
MRKGEKVRGRGIVKKREKVRGRERECVCVCLCREY